MRRAREGAPRRDRAYDARCLKRLASIDAIRGIALLGVLTVNLLTAFRVSVFAQLLPGAAPTSAVVRYGLEFKAITLFSFLFGVGLAAQRDRGTGFLVKRLAFLLVLGLVHLYFVWNGDILALYGLVGLACAPFLRLPVRALLAIGIAFLVIHALPIPWPAPFASMDEMERHIDFANHVYPYGGFRQVLAFRIEEVKPISRLLLWTAPRTFGLFFLGAWAWRVGVFDGAKTTLVRAFALFGTLSGALMIARDVSPNLGSVVLGLGYGAIVLALFDSAIVARVLSIFVPIGRMSLTSYLGQSVVLGFVFYGYGLGLFGRLGEVPAFAIGLALYVVQMIASALWLRRHPLGPAEWLWRRVSRTA